MIRLLLMSESALPWAEPRTVQNWRERIANRQQILTGLVMQAVFAQRPAIAAPRGVRILPGLGAVFVDDSIYDVDRLIESGQATEIDQAPIDVPTLGEEPPTPVVETTAPAAAAGAAGGRGGTGATEVAHLGALNASVPWQMGLEGQEVLVGLIDSGVDVLLSRTSGRIRDFRYFVRGREDHDCVHIVEQASEKSPENHGTHVAARIGGSTRGLAKQCGLVVAAVEMWKHPSGLTVTSPSLVVCALEWLITYAAEGRPAGCDAINVSIGGNFCLAPQLLPICDRARNVALITVVAGIGNDGSAPGRHGSPGNLAPVVGVGATSNGHAMIGYSAWGASLCGGGAVVQKPDLAAPGISRGFSPTAKSYRGTSFAAPLVTATIALLIQWSWNTHRSPKPVRPVPSVLAPLLWKLLVPVRDRTSAVDVRAGGGRPDFARFPLLP